MKVDVYPLRIVVHRNTKAFFDTFFGYAPPLQELPLMLPPDPVSFIRACHLSCSAVI